MRLLPSIVSGLAASAMLTVLHQALKTTTPHAPKMDRLGMQALGKLLERAGKGPYMEKELYQYTLVGDIAGNALYYSLVGLSKKNSTATGAALGLAAGIGAIALPSKLHLDDKASNATIQRRVLTVALYTVGGLIAGVLYKSFHSSSKSSPSDSSVSLSDTIESES